ncbi:MAG TPA: hypothetical protein VHZ09_17810 [Acidobacteriaceae bacterium]|jgi:hypothetical protein|nr:hypothetical protein [Acidobacteriaceae bacterium]
MHMHGIQSNQNFQVNPAYVARAEARREAARTRAKLRSEASALANDVGDEEGFVVSLRERGDPRQQSGQEEAEDQSNQRHSTEQQTATSADETFSDYA